MSSVLFLFTSPSTSFCEPYCLDQVTREIFQPFGYVACATLPPRSLEPAASDGKNRGSFHSSTQRGRGTDAVKKPPAEQRKRFTINDWVGGMIEKAFQAMGVVLEIEFTWGNRHCTAP